MAQATQTQGSIRPYHEDAGPVVEQLNHLLADTYMLYLKTHNYHWNVTGPLFHQLHNLLEEQYQEIWKATDLVAERIRSLDAPAPATHARFSKLAQIQEDEDEPEWQEMVARLIDGHDTLLETARATAHVAEEREDQATLDIATGRIAAHEKMRWMLRSTVA